MTFWIAALGMTGAVVALMVLALYRGGAMRGAAESDISVYKDQLAEVERDLARGVITEAEADTIRVEVSRRLLDADRAAGGDASRTVSKGLTTGLAVVVALAMVAGAAGLYWRLGQPGYPDLPLAERIAAAEEARANRPSQAEAEAGLAGLPDLTGEVDARHQELVAQLRAAVAERPDDLQGQVLLARNEAALGNFVAAHEAQARVIALLGAEAPAAAYSDYADLLVLAAGGYVSPEAERAVTEALQRDPANGAARYYAGLLFLQTGRPDRAFRLWDALLRESEPGDPWVPPILAQIMELSIAAGERDYVVPRPNQGGERGPTQADIDAAADMTPQERMEMIQGMIGGLAERLATEGGPPEDWARLITSLGAVGNQAQALAIATEAEQVFAGDDDALLIITRARQRAGI